MQQAFWLLTLRLGCFATQVVSESVLHRVDELSGAL